MNNDSECPNPDDICECDYVCRFHRIQSMILEATPIQEEQS